MNHSTMAPITSILCDQEYENMAYSKIIFDQMLVLKFGIQEEQSLGFIFQWLSLQNVEFKYTRV